VTVEDNISFELNPNGTPSCSGECDVTGAFAPRGVTFSFTAGDLTLPATLIQGGVYQSVADAQNHVLTRVQLGVLHIDFSQQNQGVTFDLRGNNAFTFDNFVAYDVTGAPISADRITISNVSTYVQSASGGLTFRKETVTILNPLGVGRIDADFDPFIILFDNFVVHPPPPPPEG
jgi:hypothetical protein